MGAVFWKFSVIFVSVPGEVGFGDSALFVIANVAPDVPPVPDGAVTVKVEPLLTLPFASTVTLTVPAAIVGTVAVIDVLDQDVTVAAVDPKSTAELPWDEPKFEPLIVTDVPSGPDVGLKLEMTGAALAGGVLVGDVTVKVDPLLTLPFASTVTLTVPAAIVGTVAVMAVFDQDVTVAAVEPKSTVELP